MREKSKREREPVIERGEGRLDECEIVATNDRMAHHSLVPALPCEQERERRREGEREGGRKRGRKEEREGGRKGGREGGREGERALPRITL